MSEMIHSYPTKITGSFKVILLLIPAIVFAVTLAILIAIKF
ncbi:MAG TPA: hypothetical protein VG895_02000 [Patescibacteria group bacterium]|nr:hypothetical protein [Patescibacteria group bacterium]